MTKFANATLYTTEFVLRWLPIRLYKPTCRQLYIRLDLRLMKTAREQVSLRLLNLFLEIPWCNISSHRSAESVICPSKFQYQYSSRTPADLPASLIPASLLFLLAFYQTCRIWASRNYCEPRTHYLLFATGFGFSALKGYIHLLKRRLRKMQLRDCDVNE